MQDRFATRLVAGLLIVSLPIAIVMAVLLTSKASNSLTAQAGRSQQQLAHAVALHVEGFISERQENLKAIAQQASAGLSDPALSVTAASIDKATNDYRIIEVTDLTGRVLAASRPVGSFNPVGQPWFSSAVAGKAVTTSPVGTNGDVHWYLTSPVFDPSSHQVGLVIADLDPIVLNELLSPELANSNVHIRAVDSTRHLVYDTQMGHIDSPAALLAHGGLQTAVDSPAVTDALNGQTGYGHEGSKMLVGYHRADGVGWAIVVESPVHSMLASVDSGRNLAWILVLVAVVVAIGFSILFARRVTAPIVALVGAAQRGAEGDLTADVDPAGAAELRDIAGALNAMLARRVRAIDVVRAATAAISSAAAELSASSEELAAATTEQSAAVTEVSATTEELSRASAAIADTVGVVAVQAAETRENLEEAEADIVVSSERTLALAERVGEIGAILTLINDIADQTNLLALNAAIEAARAGDSGRGFAVVAEEVRRLAERSKTSAGEINTIIEGIHTETNASVMAMEKGAKQMHHGLVLLEGVNDVTDQVRLTAQQQRSATGQVVETMEQLTDASRQVSATATQIAASAANLVTMAEKLDSMNSSFKDHRR